MIIHDFLLIFFTSDTSLAYSITQNLNKIRNDTIYNRIILQTSAKRFFEKQNNRTNFQEIDNAERTFKDRLLDASDLPSSQIEDNFSSNEYLQFRRAYDKSVLIKHKPSVEIDNLGESGTSKEIKDWKATWVQKWRDLKNDALRSPIVNMSRGHIVNMAAARPWRVPCGDINKQDFPWGTCTLPYECDAEYRIFRGDDQCRTLSQFVCCAVLKTDYDMYQAMDASFLETSSASTSSNENMMKDRGSKENRKRKERRFLYRLLKAKRSRKRKIKRTIRRLEKAIRKELNRAFRNSSNLRQKTIRNLKTLIETMKRKLKQDRYMAMTQHNLALKKIDSALQGKLDLIRDLNHHFLMNDTFRDIVITGTMSPEGARMLVEAYPELESDLKDVTVPIWVRRSGGDTNS